MTGIALFFFPFAGIPILAAGFAQLVANRKLRQSCSEYTDLGTGESSQVRKEITTVVKRIFPGTAFLAISGQATIILISVFGTTDQVASVGAISRLAAVLTLFGALFSTLIVPRFARLPDQASRNVSIFLAIEAGLYLFGISVVAVTFLIPDQILWLLGENYAGAGELLPLVVASSVVSMISGNTHRLGASRGIVMHPGVIIPLTIAIQIALYSLADLGDPRQVVLCSLAVAAILSPVRILYIIRKL